MFEQRVIEHRIQKYIIGVLIGQEHARFRDLRPPKTDTNLFSYHLKSLLKDGWLKKVDQGYTLSIKGLSYVDRVNMKKVAVRSQPKIISMLLVQNSEGEILLQRRSKQPYINALTLPYGKLHIDDETVAKGASREAAEKLGIDPPTLRHVGDCYIRVYVKEEILSTTLAHVFRFETDAIETDEAIIWADPHKLGNYQLAPAVEAIISRSFFGDDFFFAEFNEDWYSE